MTDDHVQRIQQFPAFQAFTPLGIRALIERGIVRECPGDQELFREGDRPEFVLLVLAGRLEVFVVRDGRHFPLAESVPGTIVGELSVLCGNPRSAGLRTKEPSTLLLWEPDEFRRLLLGNPTFAQEVFGRALRMLLEKEHALIDSVVRSERQ